MAGGGQMAGRGQKRHTAAASPAASKAPRVECVDAISIGLVTPASASASTSASASAAMSADHGTFKLNASYLACLDVAWQKINNHPVFQGIPRLQTAPMTMTGFDVQQFTTSMGEHGCYTCGGNLFWANPFYTGTPGVPINRHGALIRTCPGRCTARWAVSPCSATFVSDDLR
jgi:hypothetical protein